MQKNNYILKVSDSSMPAIKKALQDAGIKVESIFQIHKEDIADNNQEQEG